MCRGIRQTKLARGVGGDDTFIVRARLRSYRRDGEAAKPRKRCRKITHRYRTEERVHVMVVRVSKKRGGGGEGAAAVVNVAMLFFSADWIKHGERTTAGTQFLIV